MLYFLSQRAHVPYSKPNGCQRLEEQRRQRLEREERERERERERGGGAGAREREAAAGGCARGSDLMYTSSLRPHTSAQIECNLRF